VEKGEWRIEKGKWMEIVKEMTILLNLYYKKLFFGM